MSLNGDQIQEYLTHYQYGDFWEVDQCGHRYSQNGTISCVRCGKKNLNSARTNFGQMCCKIESMVDNRFTNKILVM
jgi:hypothetical protein